MHVAFISFSKNILFYKILYLLQRAFIDKALSTGHMLQSYFYCWASANSPSVARRILMPRRAIILPTLSSKVFGLTA